MQSLQHQTQRKLLWVSRKPCGGGGGQGLWVWGGGWRVVDRALPSFGPFILLALGSAQPAFTTHGLFAHSGLESQDHNHIHQ